MALYLAKGTVALPGAVSYKTVAIEDGATGAAFQPVAVLFFDTSLTTFPATGKGARGTFGLCDSALNQAAVSWYGQDAINPTNTAQRFASDAAIALLADVNILRCKASVAGFAVGSMTLHVDNTDGNAEVVHYLAIGGTDITGSALVQGQIPASDGTQILALPVGGVPSVLFAALAGSTATDTISAGSRIALGAATATNKRFAHSFLDNNGVTPSSASKAAYQDRLLADHTNGKGDLTTLTTDSATITWTGTATRRRFAVLALLGGRWAVGEESQPTSASLKATTGVGLQPSGLIVLGTGSSAADGTSQADARAMMGASDGVNEGAASTASNDNVNPSNAGQSERGDRTISFGNASGTSELSVGQVDSFDTNGFTLNWSVADATARKFGWIAVAPSPTGLRPAGIPSSVAFGTPAFRGPISAIGIPSSAAFGKPSLSGGRLSYTPTPPPKWRVLLMTLDGEPVGEVLDMHERSFKWQLNKPGTISFKVNLISPQSAQLLQQKEGLVLLYRDEVPAMVGEITTLQTVGNQEGHSVAVVATETMWPRLQRRLIGRSLTGTSGPTTPTDQGTWLLSVLDGLNNQDNTGLRPGTVGASSTIKGGGPWYYKPYIELVQELGASIFGFDFWQSPLDPAASGGDTGLVNIASVRGAQKPNVVFEFGTGRANAREYQYLIDTGNTINIGYLMPPGFPNSSGRPVTVSTDTASISARGQREEVLTVDLTDDDLRQSYGDAAVAIRKQPREQFLIQPNMDDSSGYVDEYMVDYDVGDVIRGRVEDQGILLLDALVRVYGVQVDLDDNGQETVTLTLIDEA